MTDAAALSAELGLIGRDRLIVDGVDARFPLAPGDRALVATGETVVPGAPIVERLRDARIDDVNVTSLEPRPASDRATRRAARRRRRGRRAAAPTRSR